MIGVGKLSRFLRYSLVIDGLTVMTRECGWSTTYLRIEAYCAPLSLPTLYSMSDVSASDYFNVDTTSNRWLLCHSLFKSCNHDYNFRPVQYIHADTIQALTSIERINLAIPFSTKRIYCVKNVYTYLSII